MSGHTKQSPMDPNMIWASNSYLVVFQVDFVSFSETTWKIFSLLGPCCWYEDTDSHWGTFWGEPCRGGRWIWKAPKWIQLEVAMSAFTYKSGFFYFHSLLSINSFLIITYKKDMIKLLVKQFVLVFFAFRIWNLLKNFLVC